MRSLSAKSGLTTKLTFDASTHRLIVTADRHINTKLGLMFTYSPLWALPQYRYHLLMTLIRQYRSEVCIYIDRIEGEVPRLRKTTSEDYFERPRRETTLKDRSESTTLPTRWNVANIGILQRQIKNHTKHVFKGLSLENPHYYYNSLKCLPRLSSI
jgi:hypothetical protein